MSKSANIDPRKNEYLVNFKSELIEFIKASNIDTNNIDKIEAMFNNKVYLMGNVFYDLYKEYKFDLNSFSKKVFKASKAKKLAPNLASKNLLSSLFHPFLNSQSTFFTAADIGKSRFSRILKLEDPKELYADEIYGIAIAIGKNPLLLFEYFYENNLHKTYDLVLDILHIYITKNKKQSISK